MKYLKLNILLVLAFVTGLNVGANGQSPGVGYYMNQKSQQYNLSYNKLKADYDDLMGIELVNKVNKNILNTYKTKVKTWSESNFSKYDLSIQSNVDMISKFFNEWRTSKNILYETALLKSIKKELNRIQLKEPDNFYKSERYKEIGLIYKELEDCSPEDITRLAWNHGLTI